jgi:hypothetical protein
MLARTSAPHNDRACAVRSAKAAIAGVAAAPTRRTAPRPEESPKLRSRASLGFCILGAVERCAYVRTL